MQAPVVKIKRNEVPYPPAEFVGLHTLYLIDREGTEYKISFNKIAGIRISKLCKSQDGMGILPLAIDEAMIV